MTEGGSEVNLASQISGSGVWVPSFQTAREEDMRLREDSDRVLKGMLTFNSMFRSVGNGFWCPFLSITLNSTLCNVK